LSSRIATVRDENRRPVSPMARLLHPIATRLPRASVNYIKYHFIGRLISRDLDALGVLWGTDKAVGHHSYTPHYARHLRASRRSVRTVLEIGIGGTQDPEGGGNSLYMWKNYFPRARVFGMDIHEKHLAGVSEVRAIRGDQSDPAQLRQVIATCSPIDLVIDDGSHIASHILTTFANVFPALAPGGWYVIEDLETAYQPEYGGGPPGSPGTAMSLVKSLLDDVNVGPLPVEAVHAYPGIVFIRKAPEREPGHRDR
jgi:hypothetical protein